jgi:hypothetical protein
MKSAPRGNGSPSDAAAPTRESVGSASGTKPEASENVFPFLQVSAVETVQETHAALPFVALRFCYTRVSRPMRFVVNRRARRSILTDPARETACPSSATAPS